TEFKFARWFRLIVTCFFVAAQSQQRKGQEERKQNEGGEVDARPGTSDVKPCLKNKGTSSPQPSPPSDGGEGVGTFPRTNPKGISPQIPGLRGTSYPGKTVRNLPTPRGLRPHVSVRPQGDWPQPRWGCRSWAGHTQGSSCLATLGFVTESLWDSAQIFNLL